MLHITKQSQRGATAALISISVLIITLAAIVGLQIGQQNTAVTTKTEAQETEKRFILPPTQYNRDIQADVHDPDPSGDTKVEFCFTENPPGYGASVRIELEMDVKDAPDSDVVRSKVVGASVWRYITSPATVRCDNERSLRKYVLTTRTILPEKELWAEECPEIRVLAVTTGPWKPKPQEEIARISREFLCPNGVPTPSISPTSAPEEPEVTPTATPTPEPEEGLLTGRITVYACSLPDDVSLKVCDDRDEEDCQNIKLEQQESENAIWLDDISNDRTYIYNYSVSKDSFGEPIGEAQRYYIPGAEADIYTKDRVVETFTSNEDDFHNNVITPGTRDLTINAEHITCGCPFHAKTYIKDVKTGEILQIAREDLGTINSYYMLRHGDNLHGATFNNGVIHVRTDFYDFAERYISNPRSPFGNYGIDGMASVKLYAPGFKIVGQECKSFGNIFGCPGGSADYSSDSTSPVISGFRVTCGVDMEYGWLVTDDPNYTPEPGDQDEESEPSDSLDHASLLEELEGFGSPTTGGQGGTVYHVTNLRDDENNPPEGSLRWALEETPGPRIIKFDVNGTIELEDEINMETDTTIDGRGSDITLTNYGLIVEHSNIIIAYIKISGAEDNAEDAIEVRNAKNVWVHHATLERFKDGLLDIVEGSENITVSWSHLRNHDKVMLIGNGAHNDMDDLQNVTLHHNMFESYRQRSPLLRLGKVDMYNNYLLGWQLTAIDSRLGGQVLVEKNFIQAGAEKDATDHDNGEDESEGFIKLVDNKLLNGAQAEENKPNQVFNRRYAATVEETNDDLQNRLLNYTGVIKPQGFSLSSFTIIDADLDQNGVVNTADLAICISEYGEQWGICDLDSNGEVNAIDHTGVMQFIGIDSPTK